MTQSRLLLAAALAFLMTSARAPIQAREPRVRPTWGNEALWGYWEFEDGYIPKAGWKVVSVDRGDASASGAANLIDGDVQTFFLPKGKDSCEIAIDLGRDYELGAFTVLTLGRPDESRDSLMARYELRVGESAAGMGKVVSRGAFEGAPGKETVVTFPRTRGRYVTLKAFARPNADRTICLREFSLVEADLAEKHQEALRAESEAAKARWRERDSAKSVEALGREFLDLLFVTRDEIYRVSNLQNRERLLEIGKLREAGKSAEGLKVFRDYYLDKLRRPQAFGLQANDVNPFGRGVAGVGAFPQGGLDGEHESASLKKDVALADDLMKGRMTLGDGRKVDIGEPGSVDWRAPGPPYGYQAGHKAVEPYRDLWWGTGFQPLFSAYMFTKNEAYLRRWLAYMDDWALNETFLTELHPIVNHDNASYPVVATIRMIAGIAASLPYDSEAVPPAAFARIMRKLVRDSILNDIVYLRSNPNAWTPGAGRMLFAILIDEFKVAPLYFRETRRRNIEDVNVVQGLRDGTESHQWPGYNFVLLINAAALRLMDARETLPPWAQPSWERDLHTPAWQQELKDYLARRAGYLLHWTTPQGEYPLVTHHEPPSQRQKIREAYTLVPEMLEDPVNAKIYSTLYGDGSRGEPPYTSEWFPYGGYSIARDGWGPDDGYAAMFCSPRPGHGSVGSGCKNNAFTLSAFGLDLLADDLVHSYIRPTSPIQVDEKRQYFDYDIATPSWPSAHRGGTVAWTEPAPWRWHSSRDFDLMEGVYSGPFANEDRDRAARIDDVSHQRLALHARRAGLWIVTDRLRTPRPHDYEQLWWFPLKKRELAAFDPGDVVADEASRTIKTRRTRTDTWWSWDRMNNLTVRNANVSMYQFAAAPLKYASKTQKSNEELYDFRRVGVTWHGEGNQQVITAIYPRRPTPATSHPDGTENDLAAIKPLEAKDGVSGFEAETADGARVGYLSARDGSGLLNLEGIAVKGEALLIARGPAANGELSGIVLGGESMRIRGEDVRLDRPDFEFTLASSRDGFVLKSTPIYRPIRPVKVLPESDVFADEVEVRLESDTPGVRITYTLDATEPTPRSTPYHGPFKVDRSVAVKARAYRPDVTEDPPQASGTHASAVSFAPFTKTYAYAPSDVSPAASGLGCEYFEGFWKDMWLSLETLKPVRTGAVADLFDLSLIPERNRRVGDKAAPRERPYTLRYTGFMKVPKDGVYTLHAPREFVYPEGVAGYDLQVSLGHAMRLDAGVLRRENDLSAWYPATRLHGLGTWSVPLKAGYHELKVVYIDYRMDGTKRLNRGGGIRDYVWSGEKPALLLSGPGFEARPIPPSWLWH